jgi:hypothetical protein
MEASDLVFLADIIMLCHFSCVADEQVRTGEREAVVLDMSL